MHLAYIWIVCHLSAKNYQNRWKFDSVLTKTNLLSFFGTRCRMHSAKLQYKLCLRKLRKADAERISNELNDCLLQKDNDSFWKCWKSKFSSPKTGVHVVDGCTNDSDIAESFADFLIGSAGLIL